MCSAISCATVAGLVARRVDAAELDEHADRAALVLDVLVRVDAGRRPAPRSARPCRGSRSRRAWPPVCVMVSPTVEPSTASAGDVGVALGRDRLRDRGDEPGEVGALGDEVGVALELDEHADVAVDDRLDRALRGLAVGELARALLRPFSRSQSAAFSRSPSVASSAFLQSIIPAPVALRSLATSAAVTSAIGAALLGVGGGWRVGGRELRRRRGAGLGRSRRRPWRAGAASRRASRSRCCAAALLRASCCAASRAACSSGVRCTGSGCVGTGFASVPVGAVRACLRWRSHFPSTIASATIRHIRLADRMASSLPGITKSMTSGSQLVSTTAITGMPRRFASVTAMCSFLVSITNTAFGSLLEATDAPEVALELRELALHLEAFLLDHLLGLAGLDHLLELAELRRRGRGPSGSW